MSTAGIAAQEIRVPLKTGFLHNGRAMGNMRRTCWSSHSEFTNTGRNLLGTTGDG
uniref:ERBB receptor feedback inhibitor 1 n=1 Tax=Aotus nancymaae TaxID=37293 RepID=A0A2K5E8B3_AOTNA